MPNLIHSLDASSLTMLYNIFSKTFINPQFFSIHDCFGTTSDKVSALKTMLASIYTDLYTNDQYLCKFDENIFTYIANNTSYKVDKKSRKIELPDGSIFVVHDIN
jgi:DNA-directed RNA polymerase